MPNAPLRRITAALLPMVAVLCALPLSSASAHSRHDRAHRDCGLHAVVVRGEVSAPAASGTTSFTATVWSVRVSEIRLSDHSRYADDPAIAAACAAATGTTTTTSSSSSTTSSSTSGGTTCPVGTSRTPAGELSSNQIVKGVTINTGSTTKVTLDGAPSAVSNLTKEDHFVALIIVPACAGNGSNSGIPATFLAASTPHSSSSAAATTGSGHGDTSRHGDRHGDWGRERHHHGDRGHHRGEKLRK